MQLKKGLKKLKILTLIFGITFLLLELTLATYIRIADYKIELPTYTFDNTQGFWFDINKDFGTAHLPNDSYRQKKTCFDVLYKTNSHGFRDKERQINSENKRVVVLGDSFIEGIGVEQEERVTGLLESETKIPHLNYGLAGNFGPTQYYILYESLAKQYTHDAILVSILPSNDFIDDDYQINLKVGGNRYRPFFDGTYPNYSIVYHLDSIEKSQAIPSKQSVLNKFLKNFTYSYNMYAYLKAQRNVALLPEDKILSEKEVPSYFNYSNEQFNRMKFALEQIKTVANDRPIMVFSIPIYKEIEDYRLHEKNPLGKDLKTFCDSQNIEYLDLLPKTDNLTLDECKSLFLNCDGHWSEKGNRFAKDQILNHFDYYK
ncbi:hypothetical protein [Winogradskyella sp.]|uniref:hypothetical protein n=1 Tax=Winogradskyella sp. TaxID=1883156 RepID=UPI0025D23918|nr:hypothetical protein [Winogradskyella sp.]